MTDTTQAPTTNALTVNMGGTEHPLDAIPASNQAVLLQRALNHIFGNEKASFVKGRKDKAEKDAKEAGAAFDADAWEKANEEGLENEFIEAKTKVILEGTLGSRAAGVPKSSRIDRLVRAFARTAIENSKGVKSGAVVAPKKSEKGSGDWWNAMIDKVLAIPANADKFRTMAEAEMARQDAQATQLADDLDFGS